MQNKKSLNHLAIIMDGNGRWALNQDLPRTAGHAAGEHSLSRSIDWAIENKLEWLTVYAFSTENWLRSEEEVDFLMFFNRDILIRRREEFNQKGVKFKFLGDLTDSQIPEENKELMKEMAKYGIQVADQVTKHIALLIVKDKTDITSKIEKATRFNIPIITIDEFTL